MLNRRTRKKWFWLWGQYCCQGKRRPAPHISTVCTIEDTNGAIAKETRPGIKVYNDKKEFFNLDTGY
jgi:hypothetical protein